MLLVKQGKRRSLQEAVQLLVAMEEVDMPQLFLTCRDIMRATDRALAHQQAHQHAHQHARQHANADASHYVHGAMSFSSKHPSHVSDGANATEVPSAICC